MEKAKVPKSFVSKLSDADAEAAETQVWLAFAVKCGYLDMELAGELKEVYNRVMGKLVRMLTKPEQWRIREVRGQ